MKSGTKGESPWCRFSILMLPNMRYSIVLLLWAAFFVPGQAQIAFSKIISNYPLDPEAAWAVAEVADGYIVVSAGDCLGQDVIICGVVSKLDKNGDVAWFRQFDFYPHIHHSLEIRANKTFVSGTTNEGDQQFVLYCLDMDGNTIWHREYGNLGQDELGAVFAFTRDAHIVLCGVRKPNTAGMPWQMVYLIKTNMEGEVVDEHTYGFQNDQSLGRSVIQTTDQQTVFSYGACPISCFLEFKSGVAGVDTSGNLLWSVESPFFFEPDRPNVVQTDSSTLVVNWHIETILPNHDLEPPTLFYLNLSGQIQDSLVFENQSLKEIDDIEPIWGKGLVGSGSNYIDYLSVPNPDPGGWVFRVGENKEWLWDRTYTDTSYQGIAYRLQSIAPTTDGGYIAVGTIVNNMTGVFESHNWVLKLDSLGCLQPGCGEINYITGTEEMVFLKGRDIKTYPNPTHGVIMVEMPEELRGLKESRIFVFSAQGEKVREYAKPFEQFNFIDMGNVPAGNYFLIFWVGNEVIESRKIVKI